MTAAPPAKPAPVGERAVRGLGAPRLRCSAAEDGHRRQADRCHPRQQVHPVAAGVHQPDNGYAQSSNHQAAGGG